jgi:hypothetical protein
LSGTVQFEKCYSSDELILKEGSTVVDLDKETGLIERVV